MKFTLNLPKTVEIEVEQRGKYYVVKVDGYTFAVLKNDILVQDMKKHNDEGDLLTVLFCLTELPGAQVAND